jgi:hypothetical protein
LAINNQKMDRRRDHQIMKHGSLLLSLLSAFAVATGLQGCITFTRTERDVYTVTQRDTTIREDVNNAPGQRDNGTIYPSPGSVEILRSYVQKDSVVTRYYPAFLRAGIFEAASFLTAGGSSKGSGNGLFGVYDLLTGKRTSGTKTFGANMYRLLFYEWRLRWFQDSPNWTIGLVGWEQFIRQKDSSVSLGPGESLTGVMAGYVRKRFFLREEVPYVMVVPFVGLGLLPSQYINLGATIDVGSYGGFNVRGYAGVVAGSSSLSRTSENDTRDYSVSFPYFGIGISSLDFVNKTEELFIEWKDHKHSALEVSALNIDLVRSLSSDTRFAGSDSLSNSSGAFSGFLLRAGTATYPLPIGERRWFVGTSLVNLMLLSGTEIGYGFLPIRTGYRFNLLYDELNLEPFLEFNYYPSTIFHAGLRLSVPLPVWDGLMVNVLAGYAAGSLNLDLPAGLEEFATFNDWSTGYIGIGVGIFDYFHTPEQVMKPPKEVTIQ